MATRAAKPERATHRTVVLLRPSEKQKLERIASEENLTVAEVIRRFIANGDAIFKDRREEEVVEAALKMISAAAREANESMTRTMERVDRLHDEIMARDIP